MSEHDRMGPDGVLGDGVRHDPAALHLPIYAEGRLQLQSFEEPVLIHADNPHERVFIAALDGTGDDFIHDPEHATNVAVIAQQVEKADNPNIGFGYVPGPGTQQHAPITRWMDAALGYTVDERAEDMYR